VREETCAPLTITLAERGKLFVILIEYFILYLPLDKIVNTVLVPSELKLEMLCSFGKGILVPPRMTAITGAEVL
jgi:hypothetical protein